MTLPFLHGVAQRSPTSAFVIYSLFPTLARPDDVYLGLDLSTQQLKCTVINNQHHIVLEDAVNFDKDLPEFATRNGAIEEDGDVVTVPTLMWVKALDMLIEKMRKDYGFNFGRVRGIAGAGQQHGSVYWARGASDLLSSLNPSQPLHTQLGEATFAIPRSPIWQDASTTEQCRALEEVVGGPQKLADLTGSRAYERFTGNQIAKIHQHSPMAYASTERISLVSSFLATLFLGRYAPIDTADGSGMNLMNVRTRRWEPELLKQCGGPELRDKLGEEPVEGGTVVGKIDEYWIKKWGFKEDCIIAPFTGDNPATLVSMNLLPGDCVVSLGTSDTVLLYLPPNARATIDSHLLAHPTDPHANMGMLCYKNGSLVRKHVRNEYAASNWIRFNELLRSVPPGGAEEGDPRCRRYGFYYLQQEIVPFARGVHRFEGGEEVEEFSGAKHGIAAHNVRALIESQFMSMKVRTSRMLGDGDGNDVDAEDAAEEERRDRDGDRLDDDYDHPSKLRRVLAAGGASRNPALLQALADVLDLPVHVQSETNSAGLGAALLARYAVVREKGEAATFKDMMDQTRKDKKGTGDDHLLVGRPDPVKVAVYEGMVDEFVRLEKIVVARQ